MITITPWVWAFFWALVLAMIAVDLVAGRRRRSPTMRSAALWSALWIGVSVAFGVWVSVRFGRDAGTQYFAAYVLEKSLSVDNVFVFALIFSATGIPAEFQHRVLMLGILGALVMRALLIGAGVYLLARFHWVVYPFAVLLLVSAVRLLFGEKKEREVVEQSCAVCTTWVARIIPVTPSLAGGRFVTRDGGRLRATPLLVALIIVESSDLVFALDSIPAVLGITRVPFLVYSSNVFAMLGLRALYFLLAGAIERLRYLRPGLALILLFVAAKMLLEGFAHISVGLSLTVIGVVLMAVIVASLLKKEKQVGSGSEVISDTNVH